MNKIKPNQVRAFSNSQGNRSYYIVVQDGKGNLGAMWLRHKDESPMHISWKFKMEEDHDIIMENCNKLKTVFAKIDKELYGGSEDDEEVPATIKSITLDVSNRLAFDANIITSIKILRGATGLGLKEAKEVVDVIRSTKSSSAKMPVRMTIHDFNKLVIDMAGVGLNISGTA